MSNEQNVMRNEQIVTSNKQQVISNEQKPKSLASEKGFVFFSIFY